MPINIKEILTTDSDLIRVDKTNYNFDQIVANGGGPIGIKGQKGELGSIGITGSKGEKGDEGAKGEVGPSGLSINNWGRIDYDSTTDTSILKPKRDDDDVEPVSIVLGDNDYDDVNDGIVDPNAWLNVIIPDGSSFYSNFVSLLNGNTSKINFSSLSDASNGIDTYKITHDISSTNDVNFEINIKNEVLVNGLDALNLTSGGIINIDSGNNNTIIGPITSISSANLDIRFEDTKIRGDLTVDSTGYVKIPTGTTAQRPTGTLGMLRYNSNINLGYNNTQGSLEAFVPHPDGNYWKPLGALIDTDGDTFISPDYNTNDGTENVLTISVGEDVGGSFINDIVGTIGETVADGSTNIERTFTYNNVIYAKDDVLVANDAGLRIKQNTATPTSNQVSAQNEGTPPNDRTLLDYFYRKSDLQYNTLDFSSDNPFTDPQISINSSDYRYTGDAIIAQGFVSDLEGAQDLNAEKVGIIIDHITSKMSYTKVGHIVTVWGRLDYFPFSIDWSELSPEALPTEGVNFEGESVLGGNIVQPSRRAAFTIGRPEDFPYYSDLEDNRVVFPISISLKAQDETTLEVNSRYFGVIQPGTNVFNIMKVDDSTGFISSKRVEDDSNSHYGEFLNIDDLKNTSASPEDVITLEYNFSMPTSVNSYDLGSSLVYDYQEDGTPVLTLQPGTGG